jgi:nitroreductase
MNNLIDLIKQRQSSRTPFDPERPVSKAALQQILEAGAWAPTAHNMQNFEVVVIDDEILLQKIRALDYPVTPAFVQENYLQLSFSEDELQKRKTGVLATLFPKSWHQPGLIPEHSTINEPEHSTLARHNQLLACPTLVLILYDPHHRAPDSEGDFLGIMSLGCVLENMWLMATELGIGFHVVSALSGSPVSVNIKHLLGIPNELNIALAFRLGYPLAETNHLRVRRDTSDFVHFNGFVNNKKIIEKP